MKPRDIFLLIVKLVGVFFLYQAAVNGIAFFDRILFAFQMHTPVTALAVEVLNFILKMALAVYFFLGALPFSQLAYPNQQ